MKNLLPRTKNRFSPGDRNGEVRAQGGRLQMGVCVSVVPGLLVTVVSAGGIETVELFGEVSFQTRLELNRSDGTGAADIENRNQACFDLRLVHNFRYLTGKIVHVSMTAGGDFDVVLMNHGLPLL